MMHMPAWTTLTKGYADAAAQGKSFGVGIWHEIYQVHRSHLSMCYNHVCICTVLIAEDSALLHVDHCSPAQ